MDHALDHPELKKSAGPAGFGKRRMIRLKDLKPFDLRVQRTPAAGLAERGDGMLSAGEDRLDIAVAAIADPAGDAASFGVPLRESPEADALYATAHSYADDFFCSVHGDFDAAGITPVPAICSRLRQNKSGGGHDDLQSCFFLKSAT